MNAILYSLLEHIPRSTQREPFTIGQYLIWQPAAVIGEYESDQKNILANC